MTPPYGRRTAAIGQPTTAGKMLYVLDDTLPVRRCFISPQTDNAYIRQDVRHRKMPCALADCWPDGGYGSRNSAGQGSNRPG